jgi:transcriptional regulator of arginine metabolism
MATAMTPGQELKRLRQRVIRSLVVSRPIGSQRELVDALTEQGFDVTQATVSRDIAELGLLRAARADGPVYVTPDELPNTTSGAFDPLIPEPIDLESAADRRLVRALADAPVTVGRSGLILLLIGKPATAHFIAQAIDESSLHEQEGTVAGDNTTLVLFADEQRLERWLERFTALQQAAEGSAPA